VRYTVGVSWEPVLTGDGSCTLRCPRTGALSHSTAGAWTEAVERYAIPTRLAERARSATSLCLLDVGTGLGWNLAAALDAVGATPLHVVTLELDPGSIRAGLALAERGDLGSPELVARHAPVARALGEALDRVGPSGQLGSCLQPVPVPFGVGGSLRLLLGDGRRTLPAVAGPFDAVFLDPFAPAQDPPLWHADFLAQIARRMAPGGLLSTYSASLTVRARLAGAGLRVGRGPRVGGKAQGTLATPDVATPYPELPALDPRTARKLARRLARGPQFEQDSGGVP
jgi:uncharacterized protein